MKDNSNVLIIITPFSSNCAITEHIPVIGAIYLHMPAGIGLYDHVEQYFSAITDILPEFQRKKNR